MVTALVSLGHGLAFAYLLQVGAVAVPSSAPERVLRASWIDLAVPAEQPLSPQVLPVPQVRPKPLPVRQTPKQPLETPLLAASPAAGAEEASVAAPATSAPAAIPMPPAPVIPPRFEADYLSNPAPDYPRSSRELGEQGRVVLRVLVSPQGLPLEVHLYASSRHERLDQAALAAVRAWRFVPARQGDEAVAAWVLVPVSFSLRRVS